MTSLVLVLADSSLEPVPREIAGHPEVVRYAKRRGKDPKRILLDRSYHHRAMKGLSEEWKRGRPDIVHFSLLEATSIPLYYEDRLLVYIHTYNGEIIEVGKGVRLPKSYHRFVGLMEKLFSDREIEANGEILLRIVGVGFDRLLDEIGPTLVLGLEVGGERSSAEGVAKLLLGEERPVLVVGAFPRGEMSEGVLERIDAIYSISDYALESHVVVARVLYEYEKGLMLK